MRQAYLVSGTVQNGALTALFSVVHLVTYLADVRMAPLLHFWRQLIFILYSLPDCKLHSVMVKVTALIIFSPFFPQSLGLQLPSRQALYELPHV